MSHTPGPWIVRDIEYGALIGAVAWVKFGPVAWVGFGTARCKEEHMANARLMAAAPELLDTLQIIQTWASCDNLSGEPRWQAMSCIEEKCKEALQRK